MLPDMTVFTFPLIILSLVMALPVSAVTVELSAEAWARPHSGMSLTEWPELQSVVQALDVQPGSRLKIHYPGGEEGAQWAYELRAWLIALGVSGQRIELLPGGMSDPGLRLEVQSNDNLLEKQP